jgi:hypothetical protein
VLSIFIRVFFSLFHLLPQINGLIEAFLKLDFSENLELYCDYHFYYKEFAKEFASGTWIPYLENANIHSFEYPLLYPPFFLYAISFPALINPELTFIPLLLADCLLPVLIYKILGKFHSKKIAEWGFLVSAFSPFLILYTGILFLNTSLVILFFILSLYFVALRKYKQASVFLGISFLFKQIVLFFIIPVTLYMALDSTQRDNGKRNTFKLGIKYLGLIGLVIFLGSLPWILISPLNYFNSLSVGQLPYILPEFSIPETNEIWPVKWYDFLILLNAPYWLVYIAGFLNFTLLGFFIVQSLSMILLHKWYSRNTLDFQHFLDSLLIVAFLSHLWMPRGVYKYYFTFLIPIVVLWFGFHYKHQISEKGSERRKYLSIITAISFGLIIIHRYLYLLIIWLLLLLVIMKIKKRVCC